jgi:hypothetical protein
MGKREETDEMAKALVDDIESLPKERKNFTVGFVEGVIAASTLDSKTEHETATDIADAQVTA